MAALPTHYSMGMRFLSRKMLSAILDVAYIIVTVALIGVLIALLVKYIRKEG